MSTAARPASAMALRLACAARFLVDVPEPRLKVVQPIPAMAVWSLIPRSMIRPQDSGRWRAGKRRTTHAGVAKTAYDGGGRDLGYCAFRPVALTTDVHFSRSWRISSVTLAGGP